MNDFIIRYAGRILFPWLLLLSLVVLYRGHNLPGGGFIGGLLAAGAFILLGVGRDMSAAKSRLRVRPVVLMGSGLAVAVLSGVAGILQGEAFMTGQWLPEFELPLLGKVHWGTPLLFDVGVYLSVIGFALHTTFSLFRLGQTNERRIAEWKD